DFVPTAIPGRDLQHGRYVKRWRRLFESRPELIELHAGGDIDALHGVRHHAEVSRFGTSYHGTPQDSVVGSKTITPRTLRLSSRRCASAAWLSGNTSSTRDVICPVLTPSARKRSAVPINSGRS